MPSRSPRGCDFCPMAPYETRSSITTVRWLVRLRIGVECMCARASDRFQVGPVSAVARLTYRRSSSTFCWSRALATAASSVLDTTLALRLGVNSSTESARSIFLPTISSHTSRSFCGEIRTWRVLATDSIAKKPLSACRRRLSRRSRRCRGWRTAPARALDLALSVARMAMEGARGRKLTEFMTNHVLGAVDRDELVAVMHRERQPHHVRHHHRAP